MTSIQIEMADLPAHIADALVLSARFCGLSMIDEQDGEPAGWFVVVELGGGQAPLEVTPAAFALLATLTTSKHERTVVLARKNANEPFYAAGLLSEREAEEVVERLRGGR